MKHLFCILLLALCFTSSYCQKNEVKNVDRYSSHETYRLENYLWSYSRNKSETNGKASLDFNAIDNWQLLGKYLAVTNNGSYIAYSLERGGAYDNNSLDSLIVQSTENSWRRAISDAIPGSFVNNNKQYLFLKKDALYFLELGSDKYKLIDDVKSYRTLEGGNQWVAYQLKNDSVVLLNVMTQNEKYFPAAANYSFDFSKKLFVCISGNSSKRLFIYNLITGKEQHFTSVDSYLLSSNGGALLVREKQQLQYVNLEDQTITAIRSANDSSKIISSYQFDASGKQVVFTVTDNSNETKTNSVWYYHEGMDNAVIKVNNKTSGIPDHLQVDENANFSDNGRYIQFVLEKKPLKEDHLDSGAQLDVWNYKDLQLQSSQSYLLNHPKSYKAIFNLDNGDVIPIGNDQQHLYLLHGNSALLKKTGSDIHGDRFWEQGYGRDRDSNWIVSLADNSRTLLPTAGSEGTLWFSPEGNYLVYFDHRNCHYYSYQLQTKALVDISPNVSKNQLNRSNIKSATGDRIDFPAGIAAWMPKDKELLVYDDNDIWKLDLTGKRPEVNITNGFGYSNDIIFSLFNGYRSSEIPTLSEKQTLILRAFNTRNKYTGFYKKGFKESNNPKLLYMGAYFMEIIPWCQDPNLSNVGKAPLRAKNGNKWIVQRESVTDAPNYYETSDFKSFKRLTNYQPQKSYNWLSEELHFFKHLDGNTGQGILYKPENFDPSKKYPVLIVFYGKYSNNLYQFPIPAYNWDAISPGQSPAWFLNNGYLVFTPDMYVSPLRYGPEAFNVIEGAAQYLKTLPYVDADKIGCASHSWSSKLGAYIFTHSKSISAISMSEGFLYGNMINVALSNNEQGISKLDDVENGQEFGNFWENKDLWLDQTTVLNVDKAKIPLLLYCQHGDPRTVEYPNQTLQIFNAMRRLEKKVWWLQYDKGEHTISDLDEQKDYTIRYTQFFDHYLKAGPAPKWMTQGIPYSLRGVDHGYELDPSGTCSLSEKNDCPICKKWNEQFKKHPEMFNKPISEWHLDENATSLK